MVDDERLKQLRDLGIKTVSFVRNPVDSSVEIGLVEFFPSIPPLDLDTLVPPADESEAPVTIPPALSRILGKPSVS